MFGDLFKYKIHLDRNISFIRLHKIHNRATPGAFSHYKLALQLHKNYNDEKRTMNWVALNTRQVLTSRQITWLNHYVLMIYCGLNNDTFKLFLKEHILV